ncbi:MAG TPA: hypothetical protein PLT28_00075 [Saprospiraceae bacterium]|nr:hypothetical protein [Saprospiraceae bacterium]
MKLENFLPLYHIVDAQIPFVILIDHDNYGDLIQDCRQNIYNKDLIDNIESALSLMETYQQKNDWEAPFGFRLFTDDWNLGNYHHYVGDIECYTTKYKELIGDAQYHLYYYKQFVSLWTEADFNNFLNWKGE